MNGKRNGLAIQAKPYPYWVKCYTTIARWGKTWGLFIFMLLASHWGTAQCTLACNGTPNSPLNVAVDGLCQATLTADVILEDPGVCPGPKELTVTDLGGNVIVSGPDPVILTGIYMGQVLAVTVYDVNTTNECTGYISLMDNLPPVFVTCSDVDVYCNASTTPAAIGLPQVADNCDQNVILSYFDQQVGPDCNIAPPYIGHITRTWTATDNQGNSSQCVQTINLLRVDFDDIDLPPPFSLECDNVNTDPFVTGAPEVDGIPLMNAGLCAINVTFTDNIIYTCLPATHSYQIIRTWTLVNNCTNEILNYQQTINVEDTTPPTINCPAEINVGTDPAQCTASVLLPTPTVFDNCSASSNISFTVTTSFGGFGFGPHFGVPAGAHTITYTATDECGNMQSCETTLLITDNEAPTPVCDEFTVVSIPTSGIAIVPALNLDDGSYDNCMEIAFLASRNGGITFAPYLNFTCNDVGQTITVILRVYEVGNPSSFNDCEVEVSVDDKLPPIITCPPSLVVDCGDDFSDLDDFGTVDIFDNCGFTLNESSTENLSNCGVGTITRTFVVTDIGGNSNGCTQTISVENLTPFNGNLINWPPDYEVNNACIDADELDPEDLPAPFDYPTAPDDPCALLATNYSDQIFYIAYPACYKIVRTWTVMDWCTFDPDNPNAGGIWTNTQVIKTNDFIPPTLTVPQDTMVAVDDNCQFGEVFLDLATATDCDPNVTITNNSPYAFSNGADASGLYPLGTTNVYFTASDGCDNQTIMSVQIMVKDKKPPVLTCNSGIGTELAEMPDTISVAVPADIFISNVFDNCSNPDDLLITYRIANGTPTGPPSTTSLDFFCSDVGEFDVEVWVTDEEGNSDFCITSLEIQDNMGICPPMMMLSVAGALQTEDGVMIDDVATHLTSSNMPSQMEYGSEFYFQDVMAGHNYTVSPERDSDPLNGVTTFDMVLVSRHILGVDPLDSPYKIIAADANNSGSVTTFDLVIMRKIILTVLDEFPDAPSWRFVDEAYEFPDPTDPFNPPFPEVVNLSNLNQDEMNTNFIGVKMGDVNGSAQANTAQEIEERGEEDLLVFRTDDQWLEKGEVYSVDIEGLTFREILGFQFTMEFDPEVLDFIDVTDCALPNLKKENFGMRHLESGYLTAIWYDITGQTLEDGACLFQLQFTAKRNGWLSESLQLHSKLTTAEAYTVPDEINGLELVFRNTAEEGSDQLEVYQNYPNPFMESTEIRFYLPQDTEVQLTIFDPAGNQLYTLDKTLPKGYHQWAVERTQLKGGGMYYYQLEANGIRETRKMLVIN
jgi:hypothetical protein